MTYPSTGGHDPSVPAGGTDRSDNPGPTIQGYGMSVPRAVYHAGDGYHAHRDRDETSTPVPVADRDRDDGLPDIPRYEGPTVADQPALVNPSVGNQGPVEQGMADVNPMGPAPHPGTVGPVSNRVVYPDTTQDIYPR